MIDKQMCLIIMLTEGSKPTKQNITTIISSFSVNIAALGYYTVGR